MQAIDAKSGMNLSDLTRDEKREIWIKRQGETLENLAVVCGCGISALSRHFRNDTMPTAHHQKLVEYGMPADTLPDPLDRPRGPKPRNAMPMTALAQAQ